jgi:predicted AlkP superfamily pyrophosphatase or phosphodiesterase
MALHGTVTTSFPSTTATSLATLTTGEMPGAHGMLGYTVQVPRSGGRILNTLKWDERVDPVIWQPVPTLFERAMAAGITTTHVAAKRYENTGFTRAVFRGAHYKGANIAADLISETVAALEKSPSFVYLYVNDLDSAGHSDGVGSDKWIAALVSIDELVKNLAQKLPKGTRMWLTADHGMINASEKIVLGRDNDLLSDVALIAGEPRMRHLYLSADSESLHGGRVRSVLRSPCTPEQVPSLQVSLVPMSHSMLQSVQGM